MIVKMKGYMGEQHSEVTTSVLHLDPAAATPFTHDHIDSHKMVINNAMGAVADSGESFVLGHEVTHGQDSSELARAALMAEQGFSNVAIDTLTQAEKAERINEWIVKNITLETDLENQLDYLTVNPDIKHDSFVAQHREEILWHALELYENFDRGEQAMIVASLAGDSGYSDEFALKLLRHDPYLFTLCHESFPSFRLTKNVIDQMMDDGQGEHVLENWNWKFIEISILAEVINDAFDRYPYATLNLIENLPTSINLSEDIWVKFANYRPYELIDLIQNGIRPELKNSKAIINILVNGCGGMYLLERGLFDNLDISELHEMTHGVNGRRVFSYLCEKGRMNNLSSLEEFISYFGIQAALSQVRVGRLPREMQSYLFESLATESGEAWIREAHIFTKLADVDYVFILDALPRLVEYSEYVNEVYRIFKGASGRRRAEFYEKFAPLRAHRLQEASRNKLLNQQRLDQHQAELSYFAANNFDIKPYEYSEALDDEQIVRGLETSRCVKKAGDIADIAMDVTRKNPVTCVFDSTYMLSTHDLGERPYANNRKTLTEHGILQDLQQFLDKHRDSSVARSIATQLSYIGEREYAEAAAGIALYWKNFLTSDPERQLYLDTVVSNGSGTKSDVYMLDRILAYFSDDELERFKGRILLKGDEVSQADPEKIKVVLLDDWTISGSQLRSGCGEFIRQYPELAKSVEIQLIAASEERIALGLEEVNGLSYKEGQKDSNIPTVVRAYYMAHKAHDTADNARGARITGSHSSVDFGFATAIDDLKGRNEVMPMATAIVRPYRLASFTKENINRLRKSNS